MLVSSGAGSATVVTTCVSQLTKGGINGYAMAKCALGMGGVILADLLQPAGVGVLVIHPGLIDTPMGQLNHKLGWHDMHPPALAAARMLELVASHGGKAGQAPTLLDATLMTGKLEIPW